MTASFWDRCAPLYDLAEAMNARPYRGMLQAIKGLVPPGASVLECAAGTGAISLAVAGKASRVLCTDMSLPMLAQAQKKAWRQGLGNIRFAQRDLHRLPKGDGLFDVVVAANVLHLLENPAAALGHLLGAVRPGGMLAVPTFLQGEARPAFRTVIKAYGLLGFRYCHAFTLESYRALLKSHCPGKVGACRLPGKVPVGLGIAWLPAARLENAPLCTPAPRGMTYGKDEWP